MIDFVKEAGDRTRRRLGAAAVVTAVALVPLVAPATGQAAKARPEVENCRRLARAAQRACRRSNAANKVVFNQLRDSQLVGARGDGEQVDWTFCANGKTDMSTSGAYGTGVSRGDDWMVEVARVRNSRNWEAAITDSEGMEVGVQRRGGQWKVAVFSLDRYMDPGNVERTSAKAKCAAL